MLSSLAWVCVSMVLAAGHAQAAEVLSSGCIAKTGCSRQRDTQEVFTTGDYQIPAEQQTRSSSDKGTVGIELGLGTLGEAWNLNGTREWLLDGTLAVWWVVSRRTTLVFEFHATRVFQQPSRDAFVTGLTPMIRLHLIDRQIWRLFGEIGAGAAWSDTVVPPRGTRFNYLALTGLGVSRRLGGQTDGLAGFRWLHLSNGGREGHDRNPDIQALGGYVAVSIAF